MENKIFAGIRLRLLAAYVDGMILALPITFLLWYAGGSLSIPILAQRLFLLLVIWILLFIIINLLHDIFFTHYFGGPIGKLLTGLKVVDEHGNKLTLKRSFFRHTVGYQFSAILFGLGFLAIIKDPQKQAWHDKAVGSKVIAEKRKWPLALFVLLFLLISNLYIIYSAFSAAFSGPLPKEFQSLTSSFQTKQEGQDKTPSDVTSKNNELDTSNWQTYRNEEFGFEVKYPPYWQLEKGYSGGKYSGEDGFFEFLATEDFAGGINEVSKYKAYFNERYGSNAIIESLKVDGQEAKLILPSDDQSDDMKNRAALIIRDPTPVAVEGTKYDYLTVWSDAEHIKQILSTFRFVE